MHAPPAPPPPVAARSAFASPRSGRAARFDDRIARVSNALLALYLTGTLPAITAYPTVTGNSDYARYAGVLVLHLALLALSLTAALPGGGPLRRLRPALPLLLVPLLYVELRWLVPGGGRLHRDALVLVWEARLFPSNPSRTLALALPGRGLSEALHLAYASYYLLVALPPLLLLALQRRAAFVRTVLALVMVYVLCFAAFALFPVDGPRFLAGPAAAPEGPIRSLVLALLAQGSSRGTAFPSSHVAAALVASACALRYLPRLGLLLAAATAALTVATVYGGFHYAVDALAGVVTGLIALGLAQVLAVALAGQSATAQT